MAGEPSRRTAGGHARPDVPAPGVAAAGRGASEGRCGHPDPGLRRGLPRHGEVDARSGAGLRAAGQLPRGRKESPASAWRRCAARSAPSTPTRSVRCRPWAPVYYWQQRYDRAEKLLRESLEGRRRVLGPDHRDTRALYIALGMVLSELKRYPEAERAAARAGGVRPEGRDERRAGRHRDGDEPGHLLRAARAIRRVEDAPGGGPCSFSKEARARPPGHRVRDDQHRFHLPRRATVRRGGGRLSRDPGGHPAGVGPTPARNGPEEFDERARRRRGEPWQEPRGRGAVPPGPGGQAPGAGCRRPSRRSRS